MNFSSDQDQEDSIMNTNEDDGEEEVEGGEMKNKSLNKKSSAQVKH